MHYLCIGAGKRITNTEKFPWAYLEALNLLMATRDFHRRDERFIFQKKSLKISIIPSLSQSYLLTFYALEDESPCSNINVFLLKPVLLKKKKKSKLLKLIEFKVGFFFFPF